MMSPSENHHEYEQWSQLRQKHSDIGQRVPKYLLKRAVLHIETGGTELSHFPVAFVWEPFGLEFQDQDEVDEDQEQGAGAGEDRVHASPFPPEPRLAAWPVVAADMMTFRGAVRAPVHHHRHGLALGLSLRLRFPLRLLPLPLRLRVIPVLSE